MEKIFHKLDKYEKLQYIQNSGVCCKNDRHDIAVYLKALWLNDQVYIQEFEKYGEDPFKMMHNKRRYERQILFGFTEFKLDEHGWLEMPQLLNKEKFEFKVKNESICSNSVDIGMGTNGKWTFGYSYSTGNSGGAGSASIWGCILNNREESIVAGLKDFINQHNNQRERLFQKDTCGNYNESYSKSILAKAQDLLDEIQGKKAIQYQLF